MLRASFRSLDKVVIVESPNKISAIRQYANALPDLAFDRPELKAFAEKAAGQRERVTVFASIGHCKEIAEIEIAPSDATTAKPAAGAAAKAKKPRGKKAAAVATAAAPVAAEASAGDVAGGDSPFGMGKEQQPFSFRPTWRVQGGKVEAMGKIKDHIAKEYGKITEVILATDPDREGELIAQHVLEEVLKTKPKGGTGKKEKLHFSRAYVQSITADGVRDAFRDRKADFLDTSLAGAASTRHVLDMVFGFYGSTFVREMSSQALRSVGRVQTPALMLIEERERKIAAHKASPTTVGFTAKASVSGTAVGTYILVEPSSAADAPKAKKDAKAEEGGDAGATAEVWAPSSIESAEAWLSSQDHFRAPPGKGWQVERAARASNRSTKAPPPLTLQALMLAMGKFNRMASEDVMKAAQTLFTDGLITYPRTDSERIDPGPAATIAKFVENTYGAANVKLPDSVVAAQKKQQQSGSGDGAGKEEASAAANKQEPRKGKDVAGNVEDAHEAVRPTDIGRDPKAMQFRDDACRTVYLMLRATTIAAFMQPQQVETVSAVVVAPVAELSGVEASNVEAPPADHRAKVSVFASRVKEDGWKRAMTEHFDRYFVDVAAQQQRARQQAADKEEEEGGAAADASADAPGADAAGDEAARAKAQAEDEKRFAAVLGLKKVVSDVPIRLADVRPVERKAGSAPPTYFEGSLIEDLKKLGIGRPSTYPSIVGTLKKRQYVKVSGAGKLSSTPEGKRLVAIASNYMPTFVDYGFTARMELELDRIAKGQTKADDASSAKGASNNVATTGINSATFHRLLEMATAAARATHLRTDADRNDAKKIEAVHQTVRPLGPIATPTGSSPGGAPAKAPTSQPTLNSYCTRLKQYLMGNARTRDLSV